ncbi:MAG: type II toxin-antitoxin system RelE/ParE family toxin [Thermodesulfobacteriota bacterium]|nr:type II toxin-antitoxin system RelE/ParE family toxin [Thermodesulfobacteriota bacterium]
MAYRLLYSEASREQIKNLHPEIKPLVKSRVQKLKENPFAGHSLERELSGYRSLRAKRFRVIYKVREQDQVVEIHHVGHRKDIYQLFKEQAERP